VVAIVFVMAAILAGLRRRNHLDLIPDREIARMGGRAPAWFAVAGLAEEELERPGRGESGRERKRERERRR